MAQCLVYQSTTINVDLGHPRTAHDCAAILYVIANMQECNGMKIDFGDCGIREGQIKKLIDILASKEGKLQVVDLNLSSCRLTVSGLQALETAVQCNMLTKLEMLNLTGSLISDADTNTKWLTAFIEVLPAHALSLLRGT